MTPDGDDIAITASAARVRVDQYRLEREREAALRRVRAGQNLVAAWKPLDKGFLSAKAKLQPRDSKGRWIDMGASVRWLEGSQIGGKRSGIGKKSYKQGIVKSFDAKSQKYDIKPDGGGPDIQLEGKNLEVIKAVIPDAPGQAPKVSAPSPKKGDLVDQNLSELKTGDSFIDPDDGLEKVVTYNQKLSSAHTIGWKYADPTADGADANAHTTQVGYKGFVSPGNTPWRDTDKTVSRKADRFSGADEGGELDHNLDTDKDGVPLNVDDRVQTLAEGWQSTGTLVSPPKDNRGLWTVKMDNAGTSLMYAKDLRRTSSSDASTPSSNSDAAPENVDPTPDGPTSELAAALSDAGLSPKDHPEVGDLLDELDSDPNLASSQTHFDSLQEELDTLKGSMTDKEANKVQSAFDALKSSMKDNSASDTTVPEDWSKPSAPDAPAAPDAPTAAANPNATDSEGDEVRVGDLVDWKHGVYGGEDYPVVGFTDDGYPIVKNPHVTDHDQTTELKPATEDSWGKKASDPVTFTKTTPPVEETPEAKSALTQLDNMAQMAGWGNDGYDKAASGREGAYRDAQKLVRKQGVTPETVAELRKRAETDSHGNDHAGYDDYNAYYAGSSKAYAGAADMLEKMLPQTDAAPDSSSSSATDAPAGNITEFAKSMFQNLQPNGDWDKADQTAWLNAAKKAMEKNDE